MQTFRLRVWLRASVLVGGGSQAALNLCCRSHLLLGEIRQAHGLPLLLVQGVRSAELLRVTECLFPLIT